MESPQQPDWLDETSVEAARAQNEQNYLQTARLYLVFENHPVAKQLLAMWDERILHKRTPVDAPLTRYAADEAIRAFVAGIHIQIAKAKEVPTT